MKMKKTIMLIVSGALLFSANVFAASVGTFTGTLDESTTIAAHQVALSSDGVLTLDLVTDSTLSMSYWHSVRVQDADGIDLFTSIGPAIDTTDHSFYTPNALKAGTYQIRLERDAGYGGYVIAATHAPNSLQNDTEPNDDRDSALALALGTSVTGHLGFMGAASAADNRDWYKVVLPSDGVLAIDLLTDSTLSMTYWHSVRVQDTDGVDLFTGLGPAIDTTDHSFYTPNALKAGTYYIGLERDAGYGGYVLAATHKPNQLQNDTEPNDDRDSALTLALGASVTGHIGFMGAASAADNSDWYKVILPSDGVLTMDLLTDSTLSMTYWHSVRVQDANGDDIFTGLGPAIDTTDHSFYTPNALKAGTYYIGLERDAGYGGYVLAATHKPNQLQNDTEPNDDRDSALTLALSASVTGHLGFMGFGSEADNRDWYKVTLPNVGVLTIDLLTGPTLSMIYWHSVRVQNAAGVDVFTDIGPAIDTTDHSLYTPELLDPGIYYVGLERDAGYGGYSLSATFSAGDNPVRAGFTASPTSGTTPLAVVFSDSSTHASGTIASWTWDFGDGSSGSGKNQTHVYQNPGKYYVQLTTSDGTNSDTIRKSDYIVVSQGAATLIGEGFEGSATGWSGENIDGDANEWTPVSESQTGSDVAYTGDFGMSIFYNPTGNDDWLISPQIDLSDNGKMTASFWARSTDPSYLEDLNVKLSTTGKAVADFDVTLGEVRGVPSEWQQYTYDLSAYAGQTIYVAIQSVSVDKWYLLVDDFSVTALPAGWMSQDSGVSAQLISVSFVDANTGWTVGTSSTILKTTDGGATWIPQTSPVSMNIYAVQFVDAEYGWAVGDSFTGREIIHTSDGGATWTVQTSTKSSFRPVSVFFLDRNNGWICGDTGSIERTTDGGANWTPTVGGISNHAAGIAFADTNTGWVGTQYGKVFITTDGGSTWTQKTTGAETEVFDDRLFGFLDFADSHNGWAVGRDGVIVHTADGGLSWSVQTSNIAEDLWSIEFSDVDNGWAVGAYGTIISTTDGGTTWFKEDSGTTMWLGSASFVDQNTGWAVGAGGTILKYGGREAAGDNTISGQVTTSLTGELTNVVGATVTIVQTGQSTTTDGQGNYRLADVPVGTYTVRIEKDNLETILLTDVDVISGQTTSLQPSDMSVATGVSGLKGDINDDGRIGLEEAVNALQVVSGID